MTDLQRPYRLDHLFFQIQRSLTHRVCTRQTCYNGSRPRSPHTSPLEWRSPPRKLVPMFIFNCAVNECPLQKSIRLSEDSYPHVFPAPRRDCGLRRSANQNAASLRLNGTPVAFVVQAQTAFTSSRITPVKFPVSLKGPDALLKIAVWDKDKELRSIVLLANQKPVLEKLARAGMTNRQPP